MIRITICGDLCPTVQNMADFEAGNIKKIFTDVGPIISSSDISIANLECPLTNKEERLFKSGPNNKASKRSIKAIASVKFDVMSLANNHIKDFGTNGIVDTLECCKNNGIKVVGAGIDKHAASKPMVIEIKGIKVGIISFADNEGSLATEDDGGANGLDKLNSFDVINALKKECDRVIVLYHSGIEHYPYPSPRLQKICRKMVQAGADIVTCQHSHCIGCKEEYMSSVIVYGQGNFLFAKASKKAGDSWNFGLILNIIIDNAEFNCDYIPTIINNGVVRLAKDKDKMDILTGFLQRSAQIANEKFVQENYNKQCEKEISKYMGILLGFPRLFYLVNKLFKNRIIRLIFPNKKAIVTYNLIRCESHREVLLNILKQYSKRR